MTFPASGGILRPFRAKRYVDGATPRSYTDIADAAAHVLKLTEFTIAVHFRVVFADRGEFRTIDAGVGDSGSKQFFLRIQGGSGGDEGKLHYFYRSPSAISTDLSAGTVDDGDWHIAAVVRETGPNVFRLILDGVEENSDTTDPGTVTGDTDDAAGNFHPDGPQADSPLLGSLVEFYIIDKPMSIAQITALINAGTVPGGMSILYELAGGGDSSTVEAELGP